MSILEKRLSYKPFEYPGVFEFIDKINKTFWVHNEVDFTADIQDFKSKLSKEQRESFKRNLLAIAQIEVAVKSFWGDLYKMLPKPEFNCLGATLAENEVRHSEAYSRLLDVLGYQDEFVKALEEPIFKKRVNLINEFLSENSDISTKTLFFTLVIENCALFTQFANILSYTRFEGLMKNTSNIIAWTSLDEQIHANAGIYILQLLKDEGLLNLTNDDVKAIIEPFINFEIEFIDWIFQDSNPVNYTKVDLINFIKNRIDETLVKLDFDKIYNISIEELKPMIWFEEEVFANSLDDFFAKRPVEYTKHDKSFSGDDLF